MRALVGVVLTIATARCSLATSSSGLSGGGESDAASLGADGASDDGRALPVGDGGVLPGTDAPASCGSATDPRNCGACGHDCLGGPCTSGACGAYRLSDHLTAPGSLAIDDTYVYFARWKDGDAGLVERVPLIGGASEAVSDPQSATYELALDGTYVFFTSGGGVKRRRKDKTDAEKTIFTYGASGFAIDGADAFFLVAGGTGSLWRGTADGSQAAWLLHYPVANAEALAFVGSDVIVGQTSANALLRVPRDGGDGGAPTYATGSARRIVTDDTTLYFTQYDSDTIFAVPKATGGAPSPFAKGPGAVREGALAIDEAYVYWAVHLDSGAIMRAPRAGGAAQTLVTDARGPVGLAVDAKRVCWSLLDLGEIWCLAK